MSKQKITADNYEQLLEIVRAVQRGEDPEESLRKKELNRILEEEAAEEAQREARRAVKKAQADGPEKRGQKDGPAKSAKGTREASPAKSAKEIREASPAKSAKEIREDSPAKSAKETRRDSSAKPAMGTPADGPAKPAGESLRRGKKQAPADDDWMESSAWEESERADEGKPRKEKPQKKTDRESFSFKNLFGKLTAGKKRPAGDSQEEESLEEILSDGDPEREGLPQGGEQTEPAEDRTEEEIQADEQAIDRLFAPKREKAETDRTGEQPGAPETAPKDGEGGKERKFGVPGGGKKEPGSSEDGTKSGFADRAKRFFTGLPETLKERGFRRREAALVGIGLLIVVVMIALLVNALRLSGEKKRKMEHVTADEGLTVLVEKEPDQWCSAYPVALSLRAKETSIRSVTVNGENYVPDEKGMIVLAAQDSVLDVSVDTDQETTLSAQVELPMIDTQEPVVNVTRDQERIVVTASDARSGVSQIRYAVIRRDTFSDIPLYQTYSEPIPFEEGCQYYFYAQDAAGNRSSPTVTTMENVSSISLKQEKLSMFPGETRRLDVVVEPEGALLNGLRYESANSDVITVDSFGQIIAAGEGSTVVTVSADGVAPITCQVTVSGEQTVTISAIGDCTLGTDENFNSDTSFNAFEIVKGKSWFFQNVSDILSNDDVTFANLEGTFTTSTQRAAKEYAFKGDPTYTDILTDASIEVVTLANNHTGDYGEQGLADTKQYLTEAGIDYCQDTAIAVKDVGGIRIAFIGIYVLDDGMASEADLRAAIDEAKAQDAQLIITAFHWGAEKALQPDETQQALAHTAVDCGADLVVGHHPHVLEGIEKYNGKYIVYSLGNFCFGGNSTPSDMDTMIFRQTFTITRDGVTDDDAIEIIPCSISSEPYYNNYQPTPAEGTEVERILGRINEYSAPFGMTYTASSGLS